MEATHAQVESGSALGGTLEDEARAAAVAAALPLLVTYFSSAETWDVANQAAIADEQEQVDAELAGAIRLRAMLAMAEELISIVKEISGRPSFRYSGRAEESAGLVAGRLDIQRYAARRRGRSAPKMYPIRVIERNLATPENILALSAMEAIGRALSSVPTEMLPRQGPERRALNRVRGDLLRHRRLPFIGSLIAETSSSAQRRSLEDQWRWVRRRLERGDLLNAAPYRRLVEWVRAFQTGTGASHGTRMWAFYDNRFDSRLFEIWSLALIADRLSKRFGPPDGGALAPLWSRGQEPIGSWTSPFGLVELYFQRETGPIGLPGRWQVEVADGPIRAIPDIVLKLTFSSESPTWLLVDCKLRPHVPLPAAPGMPEPLDIPSEELYKLFGYFDHLLVDTSCLGAIIYYTPGGNQSLPLIADMPDSRQGKAALLGVDPSDFNGAVETLSWIAGIVEERVLGIDAGTEQEARNAAKLTKTEGLDETESAAAYKQRLMVEVVRNYAKDHEDQLPSIQKLTASWFEPSVWDSLDADTRRMVISAELYGSSQLEELDHSGPLLGLSAACERELNQRLFKPVLARFPDVTNSKGDTAISLHATLGGAIETLHRGRRLAALRRDGAEDAAERALGSIRNPDYVLAARLTGEFLLDSGLDLEEVKALVKRLRRLNENFRRPAAHDEVVEAGTWATGRELILGVEGLLSQIVSVLGAPDDVADSLQSG